jgi:hypothetical protein
MKHYQPSKYFFHPQDIVYIHLLLNFFRRSKNNDMHLYQHSPRCSIVMQHFLDRNPEYWCLVPMPSDDAYEDDRLHSTTTTTSSKVNRTTAAVMCRLPRDNRSLTSTTAKPMLFEEVLRDTTQRAEECAWLVKGVPKTPNGYRFSCRQIDQQLDFFKFKKDLNAVASHIIDCYKYTIIAVCKCNF